MNRRDQKKEETRNQVLLVAESLFRERGYANSSIRTIASAVPVAVQTLYNYFPSKEGILAGIAAERFRAMAGLAEQMRVEFVEDADAEGSPQERFLHLIRWGLRALANDQDFMRLVFLHARSVIFGLGSSRSGAAVSNELLEQQEANRSAVIRLFEGMQKSGHLRGDVPATKMAELYMLIYTERVAAWFQRTAGTLEELESSVIGDIEIVLRGLRPDPASAPPAIAMSGPAGAGERPK